MALLALSRTRVAAAARRTLAPTPAVFRRARGMATTTPPPAAASGRGEGAPPPAAAVQHMTVNELAEMLPSDELCEDVQFVDVREPGEWSASKLPRFKLFPMSAAADWAPNVDKVLDPAAKTIVLCHHGVRSMNAAMFLVGEKGFADVWNVTGGIDAYSAGADPSVPRY
jgi:rhodanese-related sulfurtransferase